MRVNPGALDMRITFMQKPQDRDSEGYSSGSDRPVLETWASFSRVSGTETLKNGADFSQVTARFLIRYPVRPISRKMYILYGGMSWEIDYINDYGDRREYVEIMAHSSATAAPQIGGIV